MEFGNILGFWAFSSVAALIILYLIRPKPKDVKIPSLMFLMKESGSTKQATFFRRMIISILFFLQIFALAVLAMTLTEPMIEVAYDTTAGNTVIVLDISASMQTKEGLSTRFDRAVSIAKRSIKGKSSIILAENRPGIVAEGRNEGDAAGLLSSIRAMDTRTNLGDAIVLAGDLMKGKEGRILVVSDFIWTEGSDPDVTKRLLESDGLVVDYVKVGQPASNIGIVDLSINRVETLVYVRNYNPEPRAVTLSIDYEEGEDDKQAKTILADSIETFTLESRGGITKITIEDADDLLVDNVVWISNPQKQTIKALLITDTGDIFIKNALEASGTVEVTTVESTLAGTTFKENEAGYKIIILGDINPENLPPRFVEEDIRKTVEEGAAFIVEANEKLPALDTGGLLPVEIGTRLEETAITAIVENQLTKDVIFGTVKMHFRAVASNSSLVIATANDGSPIIALRELGDGNIVYYGINDQKSDFRSSPSYPIFWNNMVNYLLGIENLDNFNFKTGKILSFENEKEIKTPKGVVKGFKITLDRAGIYEIDGKKYAVNLLSEAESDVTSDTDIKTKASKGYVAKEVERKKDVSLEWYLVIGAFILVLIELLYSKFQGDI